MTSPIWTPPHPEKTRLYAFWQFVEAHYATSFKNYTALHTWSIQHIPEFWEAISLFFNLPFTQKKETRLFKKIGPELWQNEWFEGVRFNYADLLLQGQPHQQALVGVNETGERQTYTYAELAQQVSACSAGLLAMGVAPGDRVAAVLPNIPETVIALLATASVGGIWAACSPDFGATAIIARFKQIEPSVLFISEGQRYAGQFHPLTLEKLTALREQLPTVKKIVLVPIAGSPEPQNNKLKLTPWQAFLKPSSALTEQRFPFSYPLYILFSSGTTGQPKCIIHGAGNALIQHIKELGLHCNLSAEDTLFFYTTCGWMMWNWMVSGLALGMKLVLYDGAPLYPTANRLFQLIDEEKITAFGTSAKYLSTLEKSDFNPSQHYKLTALKMILSTGSPLLPSQYAYVYQNIKSQLHLASMSGGTDIVSCFALGNPMLPVYPGEIQCLGLGMDVKVFDEQGQAIEQQKGELVCCSPFPSMPLGFWNDPDSRAYRHAYFERFKAVWTHGDFASLTPHQGLIIYGRSDTTLNRGGVRIGTAEIYHEIEKIPEIIESVVVSQPWEGDTRVILFVKLQPELSLTNALKKTIAHHLKYHASPRHVPDLIFAVPDIPKTFNGKIVELAIQQVLTGQPIQNLNAIANPEALDYFKVT